MSYTIEFLTESTDETSVFHAAETNAATLEGAKEHATLSLSKIAARIDGYRIRDESGAIVLLHHIYL